MCDNCKCATYQLAIAEQRGMIDRRDAEIDRAMSQNGQALHNAPLLINLLDAAVATLQNNLHLCDGENCTLYALLKAVEAIDPNWEEP